MRWALLLLAGCNSDVTDMIVHIAAGDGQVLSQIDHLALMVRDAESGQQQYQLLPKAICGSTPCISLPADIVLYPGPQRPGDTVEVDAQGLSGQRLRIDTALRFHFLSEHSQSLTLSLYSACLDRVPACAAAADVPYCQADGSCGQPGGLLADLSTTPDLSTPDLPGADLPAPDLLEPDLLEPDLFEPDLAPCTAPTGLDSYVDALWGSDDLTHGSGGGLCALKTVTFALAHAAAQSVIHLAPGQTFSAGETFPLSLSGQSLSCGAATTLSGNGGVPQYTVELTAPGSALHGCTLSPGFADTGCGSSPLATYTAVHVTQTGMPMQPIVVDLCTMVHSSFAIGVFVDIGVHDLIISDNVIQAINDVQVSGGVTAQVTDNQLQVGCSGTTFSVRCDSSNTVDVLGNNRNTSLLCHGTCYQPSPSPAGQQCP